MAEIIPILYPRKFSKEEAEALLSAVKRITNSAAAEAERIGEVIRFTPKSEPSFKRLSADLDLVVKRWAVKIRKLGARPAGIWIVDFESKEGWFSWRLGDENLSYFSARHLSQEELSDTIRGF